MQAVSCRQAGEAVRQSKQALMAQPDDAPCAPLAQPPLGFQGVNERVTTKLAEDDTELALVSSLAAGPGASDATDMSIIVADAFAHRPVPAREVLQEYPAHLQAIQDEHVEEAMRDKLPNCLKEDAPAQIDGGAGRGDEGAGRRGTAFWCDLCGLAELQTEGGPRTHVSEVCQTSLG
jgi:hypothetical protein